jgi:hypothetical protein
LLVMGWFGFNLNMQMNICGGGKLTVPSAGLREGVASVSWMIRAEGREEGEPEVLKQFVWMMFARCVQSIDGEVSADSAGPAGVSTVTCTLFMVAGKCLCG